MAKDRFPSQNAGDGDDVNFRRAPGALGEQPQRVPVGGIGGTHMVSTPIDPEQALTGGYQPIPGDRMPSMPGEPYLPKN